MKRIILVLALMTVLLVPMTAMAASVGQALPAGAAEVETWYWDDTFTDPTYGFWHSQGTGSVTALARCWSSNPVSGACNKQNWVINFTHHASIAQWIDWMLTGSRWDWRVRKPGTYAANCITFTLKSNNAVAVDYEGFEDLAYQDAGGVKTTIDTYYAYGPDLATADRDWVRAEALNGHDDLIPDSADLHAGQTTKLWNKIEVVNCNSSCEYEDTATITLVLTNMKFWVDPETGNFKPDQEHIKP